MINYRKYNIADLIGIMNSGFCLIHCLASPLLITIGAGIISNKWFDIVFLFISLIAIINASRNTENKKITTSLWLAFSGFFISILLEERYNWMQYSGYLFSALLVVIHTINIKNFHKCKYDNINK